MKRANKTANRHIKNLRIKQGFVISLAFLVAFLIYQLANVNEVDKLEGVQARALFQSTSLLSSELGGLSDLAILLANTESLSNQNAVDSATQLTDKQRALVVQSFINFSQVSTNISQIRWLDNEGIEQIRVEFKNGKPLVVNDAKLQDKSKRYYFERSMLKQFGEVYLSPIDLNIERGEIEKPYNPNIRATIQTSAETHLIDGLLVINYSLKSLLEEIRTLSNAQVSVHIVNNKGYWLLNNDRSLEWAFMFDNSSNTLFNQQSELWNKINSSSAGHFKNGDAVYSFSKLNIFDNVGLKGTPEDLIFYTISPNSFLNHPMDFVYASIVFLLVVLIGSIVNNREFNFQQSLITLSNKLIAEKQTLKLVNQSLEEYIARQKILQDELVETRKLASLGLMVSGVAHELNTPLGGASIALATAQRAQIKLDEGLDIGITKTEYQKAIQTIEANLSLAENNMQKAVVRIKKFEKLAIDRVNEDSIDCKLEDIINDALTTLNPLIKQKNITVTTNLYHDICLFCPTGILTQVIENLVINAINHGFKNMPEGHINILAREIRDNQVEIRVADNGVGIPPDIQNKLLEPFVTSARGKGNIGLGLYMVEQWVSGVLKGNFNFCSTQATTDEFSTVFSITMPKDLRDK